MLTMDATAQPELRVLRVLDQPASGNRVEQTVCFTDIESNVEHVADRFGGGRSDGHRTVRGDARRRFVRQLRGVADDGLL